MIGIVTVWFVGLLALAASLALRPQARVQPALVPVRARAPRRQGHDPLARD
ncbi:MAG TPA: hypothetical protein VHD15_01620 [Hyphomicrobiales bacterium]|nr:hypothetical protein [Hyphomicrobiales bacterium]